MEKLIIKSILLTFFFIMSVSASESMVRIGDQEFTKEDLLLQLRSTDTDPMEAINQIKRSKAIILLAEEKKLNTSDPEKALYNDFFGTTLENDNIIDNDPVIPIAAKNEARLKKMLFERKIAELADEQIPVAFTDEKGFWELVKSCKSYQIRKEHGVETPMSNWEYTWNELSIEPAMVVATKNGQSFLTGAEMNMWIKENYSRTIRAYAKRKLGRNEILDVCAKKVVQGKLVAQKIGEKKLTISNSFIERALDHFISDNMMTADIPMSNFKEKSFSDIRQTIYSRYRQKASPQLTRIRRLLKGNDRLTKISGKEMVYCTNAAVGTIQMDIMNALPDTDIYDWIKANSFKGSFKEARQLAGAEKYESTVDQDIAQSGIVINSFDK